MSENRGSKVLTAIKQMAEDNNQGLKMSTTLVNISEEQRGFVVGFGTDKDTGNDIKFQILTEQPGDYMACAFFIKRSELQKYLKE